MSNGKPVLDELGDVLGQEDVKEPKQAVASEKPEDVKPPIQEAPTTSETTEELPQESPQEAPQAQESVEEAPKPQKKTSKAPKASEGFTPAPPVDVPRKSKNRGRPKVLSEEERKATQIFLTDSERALAIKIGKGQMSSGIRIALEAYDKQQ